MAAAIGPLDRSAPGRLGGNWGKWYGRYARRLGITNKAKVLHSFRHGFKDAARNCDIPEDVHDAFTGHGNGSVARSYGKGHSLAKHMARVQYPGLDLTHLHLEDRDQPQ